MTPRAWFLVALLAATTAAAQEPAAQKKEEPRPAARPAAVRSPEIHADRRVTFRLRSPAAKDVKVWGDLSLGTQPLQRDEQGVSGGE